MPDIDETIEWIAQHHYCCSEPGIQGYCGNCGGGWPCVPDRLATEIKRLRKDEKIAVIVRQLWKDWSCGYDALASYQWDLLKAALGEKDAD